MRKLVGLRGVMVSSVSLSAIVGDWKVVIGEVLYSRDPSFEATTSEWGKYGRSISLNIEINESVR
jgi:hypothetical protein